MDAAAFAKGMAHAAAYFDDESARATAGARSVMEKLADTHGAAYVTYVEVYGAETYEQELTDRYRRLVLVHRKPASLVEAEMTERFQGYYLPTSRPSDLDAASHGARRIIEQLGATHGKQFSSYVEKYGTEAYATDLSEAYLALVVSGHRSPEAVTAWATHGYTTAQMPWQIAATPTNGLP